jgi:aminotransferase/cystathionine beta-lyase
MKYDFETVVDRSRLGSVKWEQMKKWCPEVAPGVVPFSIADMELKNPPELVAGLKDYLDEAVLGYSDPTPAYLDAVAGWMARRHGWTVRPEWIQGAPGVIAGFYAAIKALTAPGEGVIIQTPVYYPFYNAIRTTGRTLAPNPLVLSDGRYGIDFEDLERKARDPRNKVLLFCSPHNPVGRVWTAAELARVGEICLRHDLRIISDEIHFDLVMPGHAHTVFATLSEELARRMVVCTAPSKTFNLAGMQTSNIIIPDPDLRAAFRTQLTSNALWHLNVLGYKACELAYSRCEPWLEALLGLIHRNHLELARFFRERVPAVRVFDLEGTYLQWMDFRALGLGQDELEALLHHDAQVFLDEGYVFGEAGSGFERMNLACPTRVMLEALERLEGALRRRGVPLG